MGKLEKIVEVGKTIGKTFKKNGRIATLLFAGLINSVANSEISTLRIENYGSSTPGTFMVVYHVEGSTNGYGDLYDALLPPYNPNPLLIYSHIYNPEFKLKADSRDSNHTTNPQDPNTLINIELYNKGFQGTTNNSLKFVISKKYHSNFDWKNIFFKINQDIFDIKHLINNGTFDPFFGTNVGKIELGELDGSQTGVYNTANVEFFNHADLNRDRKVNGLDFAIWANNFGRNDPNSLGDNVGSDVNDFDAYSDIDRNGIVDINDLSTFSGEWLWDANDPNTWSRVR
jgi:hypothetical protein